MDPRPCCGLIQGDVLLEQRIAQEGLARLETTGPALLTRRTREVPDRRAHGN
ncbi:MAG TPA: hypothetical protein VLK82_19550 [Candidatus Tectomicrobia bacterium]|nr:hypothetical protein [Candidatus Tectomicrobia bacterium]